ncbi:hypothetical protein ACFQ0M_46445 [Kitasatospora aburaviensis]
MTLPLPQHGRPGAARTALFEAVTAVGDEAVALLAGCRGDTPIPGAEWTVAEAAAHLAMANELMADLATGEERPYGDGTPPRWPRRTPPHWPPGRSGTRPSSPRRSPGRPGGSRRRPARAPAPNRCTPRSARWTWTPSAPTC